MKRDELSRILMRRIVFDTSTLVSAALRPGSIPEEALRLALRHCEVCASRQTLQELQSVLTRAKFDRYLPLSGRQSFVRMFESSVRLFVVDEVDPGFSGPRCRDVKDDLFLELAYRAHADAIVASDDDLVVLDPWNEIRIVTPADFAGAFRGSA